MSKPDKSQGMDVKVTLQMRNLLQECVPQWVHDILTCSFVVFMSTLPC